MSSVVIAAAKFDTEFAPRGISPKPKDPKEYSNAPSSKKYYPQ